MTRTAIRLAAAGTALAETEQITGRLPGNLLLYEAQARKPVDDPSEERWTISDRPGSNLGFYPCDLSGRTNSGRVNARTVEFTSPGFSRGEQLVIYRSAGAARSAMAGRSHRSTDAGASGPAPTSSRPRRDRSAPGTRPYG
ncbi:hypothetical protein ACIBF6_05910 [Streptosporangium amethystogenes]|uniref:hypothetical protein n=1 Tax=Streptosporangium amethystogenes TaxID=2002 RepID=UPI0037AAB5CA